MSTALTSVSSASIFRTTSAVSESSQSRVTRWSVVTLLEVSALEPSLQRTWAGRSICPTRTSASNFGPMIPGASQRAGFRDQSHTHAAYVLSGSLPASVRIVHPQDQTCASRSSRATWRPASACSLPTSYHFAAGFKPSRPPVPGVVWNPSMSPMRDDGTPTASSVAAERRKSIRSSREPAIGPAREIAFAFQ